MSREKYLRSQFVAAVFASHIRFKFVAIPHRTTRMVPQPTPDFSESNRLFKQHFPIPFAKTKYKKRQHITTRYKKSTHNCLCFS